MNKKDLEKIKIEIAKTAMSAFISRPNHGYTYEQISIMSRRYAEEMMKQLNLDASEDNTKRIKEEMIKKFKDWFCEPYCQFYGNDDYCKTCPMNKKNEFME